jgi:hypothetical protein
MKTRLDIDIARIAHLNWEQNLENMVRKGEVSTELQSHKECDLGVWLHKTGIKKYKDNHAVRQLIEVHETFHAVADRLSTDIKMADPLSLKLDLKKIRETSREIIFLLTAIELSALEMQQRNQFLANPIQNLLKRLFEGPSYAIAEDNKVLELGHARLVHLQWSRNLLEAFHDWGKNSSLESASRCPLGAWIHSVGLRRYKSIPEIHELDKMHQAFHSKAEETIRALRKKEMKKSDKSYERMLNYSSEVIYLLSVLELRLIDSSDIAPPVNIFG